MQTYRNIIDTVYCYIFIDTVWHVMIVHGSVFCEPFFWRPLGHLFSRFFRFIIQPHWNLFSGFVWSEPTLVWFVFLEAWFSCCSQMEPFSTSKVQKEGATSSINTSFVPRKRQEDWDGWIYLEAIWDEFCRVAISAGSTWRVAWGFAPTFALLQMLPWLIKRWVKDAPNDMQEFRSTTIQPACSCFDGLYIQTLYI